MRAGRHEPRYQAAGVPVSRSFSLELPEDFPQLQFNAIVYKNMIGILNGTVAGIDLAVKAEILARVYADGRSTMRHARTWRLVVDILAHKNPTMQVLEVGAGTVACTPALRWTCSMSTTATCLAITPRAIVTTPSPTSTGLLREGQELLSAYPPMIYNTFDLSVDAAAQGLDVGDTTTHPGVQCDALLRQYRPTAAELHACSSREASS